MRIPPEYQSIIYALFLSPLIAGIPSTFFFWMIFPDKDDQTFLAIWNSALFYTSIISLTGFVKWVLLAPFGTLIGLYIIKSNLVILRYVFAIASVPVPVLYVNESAQTLAREFNPNILWAGLLFGLTSSLTLTYLTRKIDLPIKKKKMF